LFSPIKTVWQHNGGALYNMGSIRVETEESEFRGNSAVRKINLSDIALAATRPPPTKPAAASGEL